MEILIDRKGLIDEFCELAAIDSLSFQEHVMAGLLTKKLIELGFEVQEDKAGNIYGFLPGTIAGAPILFSSHMDTVEPGIGKKSVLHEDGTITSDGTTVLGADDVAGIVEILWGIRSIKNLPHRSVEVLFTVSEETYSKGIRDFDYSIIKSKDAYILDLSGDIGSAAVQAPSIVSFNATVKGRAAHAGFEPEKGINALVIASKAISGIKLGRVDDDTTVNIGKISGGTATNIVPEECRCVGEIRSQNHKKAMEQIDKLKAAFEEAVQGTGAQIEFEVLVDLEAYKIDESEPMVQRFANVCRDMGLSGELVSTFGGSDNNNFVKHGIRGIVISCAMYNVHSVHEYTKADELVKGAELVARLVTSES